MSGTSLDGLDIVICDFQSYPILQAAQCVPFPSELKQALFELSHQPQVDVNFLYQTEQSYSKFCAQSINEFIAQRQIPNTDIEALGIHGQTIRHEPSLTPAFTVQLGDWSSIAADTSITTVGDFRRKDIALGGEGAPLVPPFHQAMFESQQATRVVVNIGGIANLTRLEYGQPPKGYDSGPGNALLDYWHHQHRTGAYDHNGTWAKSGSLNKALLTALLNDDYFEQAPPKSTGRERFNPEWLQGKLQPFEGQISPEDVQTTLTELTAISISSEVKRQQEQGEVYVCGGGWKNAFLISRIQALLGAKYTVQATNALGIDSDWVEACAFAWLAANTLNRQDTPQASATGASRNAVLGGIYYP